MTDANNAHPLDPKLQSQLDAAQKALADGHPAEAAPQLAALAGQMQAGSPRRAANVHAQAAHAYADSGDAAQAEAQARAALSQFNALGMTDRLPVFFVNITRKLRARGFGPSAQTLAREFGPQARAADGLPKGPLAAVEQANTLLKQGHPRQAGAAYAEVAAKLEARQPRRAANLHAQAAHAFADGGGEPGALAQARDALRQFAALEMTDRSAAFYANITRKLRAHNLTSTADLLQQEFGGGQAAASAASAEDAEPKRGRLPSSCPTCGGPARSDQVEWIDSQSAACAYCGAVLQTQD